MPIPSNGIPRVTISDNRVREALPRVASKTGVVDQVLPPGSSRREARRSRRSCPARRTGSPRRRRSPTRCTPTPPGRPRPTSLEGLKKNVRQRTNGQWYWHWDPQFLSIGREFTTDADATTARLNDAAHNVAVPTLLVRGSQSDIVPPEAVDELLELIPSARAVEVDPGHMVADDDQDVFATHLLDFLGTCR